MKKLLKKLFKGRLKIATLFDVPIYLTVDFRIYFGVLVLLSAYASGILPALYLAALLISIYGCVVIHEYAHIFMARHYGYDTSSINIMILGGVANLEDIPRGRLEEFWVAIVGPISNIVIAILVFGLAALLGQEPQFLLNFEESYLLSIGTFNLLMAGFNLLPAFPMDGGRILRSLIGLRLDFLRATKYAVVVGSVTAAGMLYYAIFVDFLPIMIIIGILVPLGGLGEYQRIKSEKEEEERFKRIAESYSYPGTKEMIIECLTEAQTDPEVIKQLIAEWDGIKDIVDRQTKFQNRGGS